MLITEDTLIRAQGVLGNDQMDALRQIQTEQAAAATVRDAFRNSSRDGPTQENRSSGPTPPGNG